MLIYADLSLAPCFKMSFLDKRLITLSIFHLQSALKILTSELAQHNHQGPSRLASLFKEQFQAERLWDFLTLQKAVPRRGAD